MIKKNDFTLFFPILLLFASLLDTQISSLFTNLAANQLFISSYLVLFIALICPLHFSLKYSLIVFACIGLFHDLFHYGILGMALPLFPLIIYFIYYFFNQLGFRAITNFLLFIISIFIYEFIAFLLARLFQLTNLSMFLFVFYDLGPTLIFNSALFIVFQPVFHSLFKNNK